MPRLLQCHDPDIYCCNMNLYELIGELEPMKYFDIAILTELLIHVCNVVQENIPFQFVNKIKAIC